MKIKGLVSEQRAKWRLWKVENAHKSKWERLRHFVKNTFKAVCRKVWDFCKGTYQHAESVAVIVLAALGLNALLSELPFLITLPLWIEASWVIPVIAVIGIYCLLRSAEWRANRRQPRFAPVVV